MAKDIKDCHTFVEKKGRLFYILFFLLFLSSKLFSDNFIDIIFKPAIATFEIDNQKEQTKSNSVKITLKVDDNQTSDSNLEEPTITLYKYEPSSSSYIKIEYTNYKIGETADAKFNPMQPLVLDNGSKIDISKEIPAIKCQVFSQNEPIIIVYKDTNKYRDKYITLNIQTEKDKEIVRLKNLSDNSQLYVGYINTSSKCLAKCDGKLYVEKGSVIDISTDIDSFTKILRSQVSKNHISARAVIGVDSNDDIESNYITKEDKTLVWITSESSKQKASVGEFSRISINITNNTTKDLTTLILKNKLLRGAKYKKSSFFQDNKKIDVNIDKNSFDFKMPKLLSGAKTTISFVVLIDIDAEDFIENISKVVYEDKSSNIVNISLRVEKEFEQKSTIVGRIISVDKTKKVSLSGVRLYLEDGTFVESDSSGKYHFSDIEPRSHVISVDPLSIQDNFELIECKQNARMMGSKSSRFIDTSSVHIQRADFCVKKINKKSSKKVRKEFKTKTPKMPHYKASDINKYKKAPTFLWPPEKFVPDMPTVKVAFVHKSSDKVVLFLNGKKVDLLNYDGFIDSKDHKYRISKYRGVDIVDGDNILEIKMGDKSFKRKIHLSTAPVRAKFIKNRSYLKADGKNSPIIAVKLFDSTGYPLRAGMVGEFSLEAPYLSQDRLDELKDNPLIQKSSKNRYVVSSEGIAYIKLKPTSISGEVKLHFPFQNSNIYTKAWLSQSSREWLIVGFAEGDIGYKTIKDNLKNSTKNDIIQNKQISFFAKGEVSSDVLLTIAYNSSKVDTDELKRELELKEQYTVYADSTLQNNEARSSKKLYLKIEKDQFYALFGTFDTGFEEHELTKYSRRLNGVKSEFKGEFFEYNAFIAQQDSSYFKDEIQGDGTSGIYHLSNRDILFGSEKITLEVRDRYRDEIVISKKILYSSYDYTFDYKNGTFYFKEPILSHDENANPRYIIVEYELKGTKNSNYDYGARVATHLLKDKRLEVGATAIVEEQEKDNNVLLGIDAKMKLDDNLEFNAQVASSKIIKNSKKRRADATLVEFRYSDKNIRAKAYYKRVEDGFGLKQQSNTQNNSLRYGVEAKFSYWRYLSLEFLASGNKSLTKNDKKESLETILKYNKDSILAQMGYRYTHENSNNKDTSQVLSSISKRFFNSKLKLLAAYEHTLTSRCDSYPDRIFLEGSYVINQYIELFANHELLEGDSIDDTYSRAGFKTRPWKGASIENSISQKYKNDATRIFSDLGFYQGYQINKDWYALGSVEIEKSFKTEDRVDDFSAYSFGLNYNHDIWSANTKVEYRTSDKEQKVNFDFGVYTQINENLGLAFGIRKNSSKTLQNTSDYIDTKLSLGYRPSCDLVILNRLDYIYDKDKYKKVTKAINSFLLTLSPTKKVELLANYGIKYSIDSLDGENFDSLIDTLGFEIIYDISKKFEVGLNSTILHSYFSNSFDDSLGIYIGYSFFKYTYIAFGYNFNGYRDGDFSQNIKTQEGPYMKFRLKYDNETLKDMLKNFF